MAFDAHKNLAIATVLTAPVPGSSGTTLTVGSGEGARFPAAPFNATVFPVNQPPTPVNAELVRVTARTGDSLTIVRSQEGSTARIIVAGDLLAATITAKTLTDVEAGTNFPLITTPGAGTFGGNLSVNGHVIVNTDPGGNFLTSTSPTVGAFNRCVIGNGNASSYFGVEGAANNLNQGANAAYWYADAAPGISIAAAHAGGAIRFQTSSAERGRIHPSGGFSWGGTTDPGVGAFGVAPVGFAPGNAFIQMLATGAMNLGNTGGAFVDVHNYYHGGTFVGYVRTVANGISWNTVSDQRLKTDRGLITDPEVLRRTRVHSFIWNTDGTAGRGVFAQEAIAVLPSAVSIGTDERDESGNLKQPWGVDYSKYVPDLIAGWQHHEQVIERLTATVAALEARLAALEAKGTP